MIRGDFHFHPDLRSTQGVPFWCAMPWIDAEIKIPDLSIERSFTLMVDSGADSTALHVRDSVRILDTQGYRLLRQHNLRNSTGVGGGAPYFNVPAQIIFENEDGTLEGFDFILSIAKRARKGSKRLASQLRLPSILGRNVLCHFRMVMDYPNNAIFLDHV